MGGVITTATMPGVHLADFDYELAESSIAQVPLADRSASRLFVVDDADQHRSMRDFPSLVGPGDVVVINDTKVLPARLRLHKATGGSAEVLLLAPIDDRRWEALVRPSRRIRPGTALLDDDGVRVIEVGEDRGEGCRVVSPVDDTDLVSIAERYGSMPLPPYIHAALDEPDRYQTVYARATGSVAAPTAGLHFTDALLRAVEATGARLAPVELRVGLGTFRPIMVNDIASHSMHQEFYRVPSETAELVAGADRVIAVGTTTVRALESAATSSESTGMTNLFILPGYEWKTVDALLTNFHLPKSSLLVMLAAFMGPGWRQVYDEALRGGYRFLSFGDAMFVERQDRKRDGGQR